MSESRASDLAAVSSNDSSALVCWTCPARFSATARICPMPTSQPSMNAVTISLAHNPNSNMNNGVGYTPVAKFARPPQLGTDGIGADMWREARVAEFKSHDAALPLPFGAVAANAGPIGAVCFEMLGRETWRVGDWRRGRFGADELPPGDAADRREFGRPLSVRDGTEFVRDVMIGGWWVMRKRPCRYLRRAGHPSPIGRSRPRLARADGLNVAGTLRVP